MQSNSSQSSPTRSLTPQGGKNLPPMAVSPPPAEARDTSKHRMMFERTLERIAQSESFSNERTLGLSKEHVDDRPQRDTRGDNDQSSEHDEDAKDHQPSNDIGVIGRMPMPAIVATFTPLATAAAPLLGQEQIATLQKMAAAIAEIGKTGVDAKMTIQFGQFNGIADSAILGRDLRGALTIHLIGAPPHMTPANAQQLRDDLMHRLLKRKVNVSTVDFLEPQAITDYAVNRKKAED
jgi:hypothetical protein